MKKGMVLLFFLILLIGMSHAEKIDIYTLKESFSPGENITLKISLLDDNNKLIKDNVSIILEDAGKLHKIERVVPANELVNINLGKEASYGYWKIIARYKDSEINKLIMIEAKEEVKFYLEGDRVVAINTGNTRYNKEIQIVIGDVVKVKKLDLGIGEKTSFRLIAPDGIYNIKITDGKTTLTKEGVSLTGNAIGILDEKIEKSSGSITSILNPKESEEISKRNNFFVYVFVGVVIGAAILLTIERLYKRKLQTISEE